MTRRKPKPPPPHRLACEIIILAGGLSSRMGRDKSRIRLGRRTMLDHVRHVASQLGLPIRVLRHDAGPRCGPLGGIYTALKTSRSDALLFLACDMPFISPAFLKEMLKSFRRMIAPKTALPLLPLPGERTRPRVPSDAPPRRTIYDALIPATAENDQRGTSSLPLPKGPCSAKRSSLVGELTCGRLGKPLGRDEGKGSAHSTAIFASHKNLAGLPCLLHRETALPIVTRQIASSQLSLQSLAQALKAIPLTPNGNPALQLGNLNTPDDLKSARRLLLSHRPRLPAAASARRLGPRSLPQTFRPQNK